MIFNQTGGGSGSIRLASIAITAPPSKTAYYAGESFDPTGMAVTATYTNGATLEVGGYTATPPVLETDTTAVTIRYTEGGVTRTAEQAVSVSKRVLDVPVFSGSLTYDGTEQTPTFTGYDPAYMTNTGDGSGTGAGDYTAVFALNAPEYYEWSDGSTEDKRVPWSIGKATPTITANPSSVTLDSDHLTATVTVTTDSDGALSVESSDTSIATASLDGSIITISHVNKTTGSATVTVRQAESDNYTGGSTETVVTASFKPVAYTSNPGGTFTDGVAGLTDDELNQVAEAISNNSSITNETSEIWVSVVNRHISIGDQISYTLDGTSYPFRIMGFNHYNLTTASTYGSATATGKAGFLLQMVDCFNTTKAMKSSMSSSNGWHNSDLRTWMNNTMIGYLPSATQAIVKSVNISTGKTVSDGTINTTDDKFFLPAEVEVFGTTSYAKGGTSEGTWYAWYKANNTAANRVKKVNGSASAWWERSPNSWTSSNSRSIFCRVNSSGFTYNYFASASAGVPACFCI